MADARKIKIRPARKTVEGVRLAAASSRFGFDFQGESVRRSLLLLVLALLACLPLSQPVLAAETAETASSSSSVYKNDFILRSERLEQGERSNTADDSDTSDLFAEETSEKLKEHAKAQRAREEEELSQIFSQDSVKVEEMNANALFSAASEKIVYGSQRKQSADSGRDLSLFYYALIGTILVASFVYVVYLFLRGEV